MASSDVILLFKRENVKTQPSRARKGLQGQTATYTNRQRC